MLQADLHTSLFIEYPASFDFSYTECSPAPLFRKSFHLQSLPMRASIAVCGLGFAKYFINAQPLTEDQFIAPFGEYTKTLWYTRYDITDKLRVGRNVLAVMLGNGYYNEPFQTGWDFDKAAWRDNLKLALSLSLTYDGHTDYIQTDESWLCNNTDSYVRCNYLRSGEMQDLRYPVHWYMPDFDDHAWVHARRSEHRPTGVLRECRCQPIRQMGTYAPRDVFINIEGHTVVDFGQNMSGYIRMHIKGEAGQHLTVRYAERLLAEGLRDTAGMDGDNYYKESPFQTDTYILSGEEDILCPQFVYHGFRYTIIDGLCRPLCAEDICAVFVCQSVDAISSFSCSDALINQLYHMGKMSSLSNMFYMLTDCPTREKLGWCNDARASTEQLLQNFDIVPLLKKWLIDIYDSIRADGSMPGIVPTAGWGYTWGSGPISNAVLFEIPYKVYRYYDDPSLLIESLPHFKSYLSYADAKSDAQGLVAFGLPDWAGPFHTETHSEPPTPLSFTDTVLLSEFYGVGALAARLAGDTMTVNAFERKREHYRCAVRCAYMDDKSGRCRINEQTAVSMLIVNGMYDDLAPLREQLRETVEAQGYHLHCGMLGMQYLYPALDICGLSEYAYRIVTAHGRPSYREWVEDGASCMYEMWNTGYSKCHHMHSCVLSWFNQSLAGLRLHPQENGYRHAIIAPAFPAAVENCHASYQTHSGSFCIDWQRKTDGIHIDVSVPVVSTLHADGHVYTLTAGEHSFVIQGDTTCKSFKN